MHTNDIPPTLDDEPVPLPPSNTPQTTITPETKAERPAAAGLDLRGYELMDRLGGGGMGDVYRAVDPALGRDLAVKVVKAEFQGQAAAEHRFVREARITGSLQHPGIVPIYNLGRLADGRLHYTMRLVSGRTLAEIFRDEAGKPERLPMLLTIFEKICQAVAFAHSKQVLHRDLKPANVMVGGFGEVQVMDWGLAKVLEPGERSRVSAPSEQADGGKRTHAEAADASTEQTRMGHEMGTPAYMPPEQALGEWDTVDERADVFALGAILCEILTGQTPYGRRDSQEVLRKAKQGEMEEAFTRLDSCGADAALVGLCRECLMPAREGRPRNAEQVAQRVAAYLAEVQERWRRAELERATAVVKAAGERKKRRWMWTAVVLLLGGAAVSIGLAISERDAKNLAQRRLGQMEKANEILTLIFRDLDPHEEEKGGPGLRQQLSQHLQTAATQLDEEAVGDAVTVARLQVKLGRSLVNLGQVKLAIEVLEKAGKTLQSQLGPDHQDTLACQSHLALAYESAGRTADAIHLFEPTLQQQEATLGPDHSDTLDTRSGLAVACLSAGRTADAIRLFEQTLQQVEAKNGADHSDTLLSRNNLAEAFRSAGRTDDAIRLHEQTLKQLEAKHGADHVHTLASRNNLAVAYESAGRTADAIRLHEQTLKQMEAKLGPDHPNTLNARNNLAEAYRAVGRTDEAIRLHEQTIKQMEAKLGPDHPETLGARNNLALDYWSAGRTADAIRLSKQTLKQMEAKLGPDHPDTLLSMVNLAMAYQQMHRPMDALSLFETVFERGRKRPGGLPPSLAMVPDGLVQIHEQAGKFAKAETVQRYLVEQAQQQFGSEGPRTADALGQLGVNLLKQKKYSDAEPLLRRCLTIREQKQPEEWSTFHTRSLLGEALWGQKKYTEAEPLLLQGYEGMKQRQDNIPAAYRPVRLREALERLVWLYESTQQKEKAAEGRKKLQEMKIEQNQTKP